MAEDTERIIGTATIGGLKTPGQARARRHIEELQDLDGRFEYLDPRKLKVVGQGLIASADGRLWQTAPGEPYGGRKPELYAYSAADDLSVVWLRRPEHGPSTVNELREQEGQTRRPQRSWPGNVRQGSGACAQWQSRSPPTISARTRQ